MSLVITGLVVMRLSITTIVFSVALTHPHKVSFYLQFTLKAGQASLDA